MDKGRRRRRAHSEVAVRSPATTRKRRSRRRGTGRSAVNAPVVCTTDLTHAQIQIDGYRAAFRRLVGAERFSGGFRWTFRAELGLESQLCGLAEREADCCRFFSYDPTTDGDKIRWEVSGEDRVSSVLEKRSPPSVCALAPGDPRRDLPRSGITPRVD
jgi:hypothetical protein